MFYLSRRIARVKGKVAGDGNSQGMYKVAPVSAGGLE